VVRETARGQPVKKSRGSENNGKKTEYDLLAQHVWQCRANTPSFLPGLTVIFMKAALCEMVVFRNE